MGIISSSMEPRVLAQTEKWLALDKPAGWLSVRPTPRPGSPGDAVPVLADWAAKNHGAPWIVHRLDLETSGVMVFAKSAEAQREAGIWFQRHQVKKSYDALASGTPPAPVFKVNAEVDGVHAVTQFEVRESFASAFLAKAVPLTGKRHQIRRHLAARGCPILGDSRYGGPNEGRGVAISRVALHAARLELPDGSVFEAPWPEDFAGWVKSLREEARHA